MSRFQALTNSVLDQELDALREEMGLRENQKAELLRELAAIASWVFAQARVGRVIEARGPGGVEILRHPSLNPRHDFEHVVLAPDEADRLAALLDRDAPPSPALRATLQRLATPSAPPELRWPAE